MDVSNPDLAGEHPLTFEPEEAQFPWLSFVISVVLNAAAALAVFRFTAPTRFAYELNFSWWQVAVTVFALGLPLSLFEYLYHRYLLHADVLPFMRASFRAHSAHHGLTYVRASVHKHEPTKLAPVASDYAVERKEQEQSMMFPYYSLPIFYGVFVIILGLPILLVASKTPLFLSLWITVTAYFVGYEVWHAILHLPFNKVWRPRLYGSRYKRVWQYVYGFHLMHHLRFPCNESVVGFWGIALWDHLMGTLRRPQRLPLPGESITYEDAKLPIPRWPVRLCDRWQKPMSAWSRHIEELGRLFLRRLGFKLA